MKEQIDITKEVLNDINNKSHYVWSLQFTNSLLELILKNQLEIMKKLNDGK
jgi:hypothetical protein